MILQTHLTYLEKTICVCKDQRALRLIDQFLHLWRLLMNSNYSAEGSEFT